jgi:hypothetical protein
MRFRSRAPSAPISYRHPPSGSIVLVWQHDHSELALNAHERNVPLDRLIEIAESAR